MNNLYMQAMNVARSFDVQTPENSVILYSISFLPSKKNRDDAFEYVAKNKDMMMIEHTACGSKLVEMGLCSSDTGLSDDEVSDIWSVASKRFIENASGNIVAFVNGADKRSVFLKMELPTILNNPKIININNIDKYEFAKNLK